MKQEECQYCGKCDEDDGYGIIHLCHECGEELTEKGCIEGCGLCNSCAWLLDK